MRWAAVRAGRGGLRAVQNFQKFVGVESRATEKQFPRCEVVMAPGVAVQVAFKPALDY